jgi:hypothetical protein
MGEENCCVLHTAARRGVAYIPHVLIKFSPSDAAYLISTSSLPLCLIQANLDKIWYLVLAARVSFATASLVPCKLCLRSSRASEDETCESGTILAITLCFTAAALGAASVWR